MLSVARDITELKQLQMNLEKKIGELQLIEEELRAAYEEVQASEEELRANLEELSIAKIQLEEKQQQLVMAMESAKIGIWSIDLVNGLVQYDHDWLEYMGYLSSDWLNLLPSFFSMLHPDDLPGIRGQFDLIQRRKVLDFQAEVRLKNGKGQWVWMQTTAKVVDVDDWGNAAKILGTFHDIDHKKYQEIELTSQKRFIETALDNLPIGVILHPIGHPFWDRQPIKLNKAFNRIMGTIPEKVLDHGLPIEKIFPDPIYRERVVKQMAADLLSVDDKRYVWNNIEIQPLNGPKKRVNIQSVQLPEHGLVITMIADDTLRILAEEALLQSERSANMLAKQYKSILDSQSVYVLKIDGDFAIHYANGYYQLIFGGNKALLGRSLVELTFEEDRESLQSAIQLAQQIPETPHSAILRQLSKEGELLGTKWEVKAILNETAQLHEILCVGFDVTELLDQIQKTNDLLSVTQKQNSRLIEYNHITSHNLRAPVARLLGLSTLLQSDPNNASEYMEMLQNSAKSLDDMIRFMNDLLDLENGSDPLSKVGVNVYNIVQGCIGILDFSPKEVVIRVDIPEGLEIQAIPVYLDSIFYNLISNAVKYRKTGVLAEISIEARQLQGEVLILVQDNGIGIDLDAYGSKLFKMKSRLHTHVEGKGIGLFFTKRQVEVMGGRIEVSSTPNVGTEFRVYFPIPTHDNPTLSLT